MFLPAAMTGHFLFRNLGFPKVLPFNLTVGVTYRCNSRCRTCNIWKMKRKKELSLDEFDRVFSSIGRNLFWATLSGGEPFLRNDIVELSKSLYKNCRPHIINIPTNSLLADVVAEKAAAVAEACPNSKIIINLSLDGLQKEHDSIRGIKGSFDAVMKTYSLLKSTKRKNMEIGIHTVFSRFNSQNIKQLCDFVVDELKPDSYICEIAEQRKELNTLNASLAPPLNEYSEGIDYLSSRSRSVMKKGMGRITWAFRKAYYENTKKYLSKKMQHVPCFSGFASAQLSPDGDVWGCCIRAEPLGNVREANYDFRKIWFGKKADSFRKSVKKGECSCPLANAYYSSAVCDPVSLSKVVRGLI